MSSSLNAYNGVAGTGWRLAAKAVAIFIGLFGAAMTFGGVWLAALAGSWYYALAGAGLLAAAWLLFRGRLLGQAVMAGVWFASLLWALAEVGLNGWGLIPRLTGVTVMLILALLVSPALNPNPSERK